MLLFHAPFAPGLDEPVVIDRLALRLLIELGLGGARFVQPIGLVFFGVQLRSAFALYVCTLYALQYTILLASQIVHCCAYGYFTGDRLAYILPPQLGQFGIVGHIGAGGRPGDTRRAAVKFYQTAELGCPLGE